MKRVIIIIMIILIIVLGIFIYNNIYEKSEASIEDIKKWNDFLQRNRYIIETENTNSEQISNENIVKYCVYSDVIKKTKLTKEEKEQICVNTELNGYKVTKSEIDRVSKEFFNYQNVQYNFINTFNKDKEYLLFIEDIIYFTIPEDMTKIYILKKYTNIDKDENEAIVYEYSVNNNNKLEKMLNTGKIYMNIKRENCYKFTTKEENGNIIILSKESI